MHIGFPPERYRHAADGEELVQFIKGCKQSVPSCGNYRSTDFHGLVELPLVCQCLYISMNADCLCFNLLWTNCLSKIHTGIHCFRILCCHLPERVLNDEACCNLRRVLRTRYADSHACGEIPHIVLPHDTSLRPVQRYCQNAGS